jgi:hypothetical protein
MDDMSDEDMALDLLLLLTWMFGARTDVADCLDDTWHALCTERCWYMKQEQRLVAACGCVVGASETLIGACRCMATLMGLVLATLELSMSKTLIGVITDSMERSWRPWATRAEPSSGVCGWGLGLDSSKMIGFRSFDWQVTDSMEWLWRYRATLVSGRMVTLMGLVVTTLDRSYSKVLIGVVVGSKRYLGLRRDLIKSDVLESPERLAAPDRMLEKRRGR